MEGLGEPRNLKECEINITIGLVSDPSVKIESRKKNRKQKYLLSMDLL